MAADETNNERAARYEVLRDTMDRDSMSYTAGGVAVVVGLRKIARVARTTVRTIQAAIAGDPDLPPLAAVRYRGGPWRHGPGAWIATVADVQAWRSAYYGPAGAPL